MLAPSNVLPVAAGLGPGHPRLPDLPGRCDADTLTAAVWYSDLRDFTQITEQLPAPEVLAVLNSYFACVSGAVTARRGEVLQFIGDGILAIFRAPDEGGTRPACVAALEAAIDALDRLAVVNHYRLGAGQVAIRFGIGLDVGTVTRVGGAAPHRPGFNIVGPAINRTARLESLTKTVGAPLLLSRELAAQVDRPVRSCGWHRMKGVAAPQEVFALAYPRASMRRSRRATRRANGHSSTK